MLPELITESNYFPNERLGQPREVGDHVFMNLHSSGIQSCAMQQGGGSVCKVVNK